MTADDNEVGTGINLFAAGAVRGVARWFNDTSDLFPIRPPTGSVPPPRTPPAPVCD
jgi:hypothetical protein